MFYFYICLSLIVTLKAQNNRKAIMEQLEELAKKPFVELNEERPDIGVNHPHCGRSIVPREQYLTFNQKCFKNSYPNITYVIYKTGQSRTEWERDTGIQSRVLWGQNADPGEAPWVVLVARKKITNKLMYWRVGCSGTLITLEWVMTAAHCIDMNTQMYVHAGNVHWESGPKRWVNKKLLHPEYKNVSPQHDIGLLKLDAPFPRTVRQDRYIINPVCLPKKKTGTLWYQGHNWPQGKYLDWGNIRAENVTFYGWGLISGNRPLELQRADMQLMPNYKCLLYTLCIHHKDQSPRLCHGDSGGGLVLQDPRRMTSLQVGVQSSIKSEKDDDPKVAANCVPPIIPIKSWFANVAWVMDWVLETITNN